jgi:hypothetical protein
LGTSKEPVDMKRKSSVLLISGIAIAAIISVIAVYTHLRLSALEGEEHGNESLQEIANEVLTGQPTHSEEREKLEAEDNTESLNSENEETSEERAAEGK